MDRSIYLSTCLSIHPSIFLSLSLSICLSIYRSIYLIYSILILFQIKSNPSIYLTTCLSDYLTIWLSICLSIDLSSYLSFYRTGSNYARLPSKTESSQLQNKAILRHLLEWCMLRDFFKFWLWHCQKWSSYASLQKWQVECGADGLVPWRFRILPPHLSKLLRLPPKSDARSYEVLHLSRKIIVGNLKISKMKPLSGNHHLTSWHLWWRCLLYNACHLKCIFADPLQRPTPAIIFAIATKPSCCAHCACHA